MLDPPHITVFVPGYNVEPFIERCLDSVFMQDYASFNVWMVDDDSTDRTGEIMIERQRAGDVLIINPINRKMPCNLAFLRDGDPNHVIVIVDADDFLPHAKVLSRIAHYYEDPDLWLMYGSYTRHPDPTWMPNPAQPFPQTVIDERSFRYFSRTNLVYNHPLTFRRKLLQSIEYWELQDERGQWFTAAYDHTIMMPMLEMSAPNHFKWCPEILYVYNEENALSEMRVDPAGGNRVHTVVNGRPKRDQL